jgi:hypothetical protein
MMMMHGMVCPAMRAARMETHISLTEPPKHVLVTHIGQISDVLQLLVLQEAVLHQIYLPDVRNKNVLRWLSQADVTSPCCCWATATTAS